MSPPFLVEYLNHTQPAKLYYTQNLSSTNPVKSSKASLLLSCDVTEVPEQTARWREGIAVQSGILLSKKYGENDGGSGTERVPDYDDIIVTCPSLLLKQ